MPQSLDAAALRAWVATGLDALGEAREEIDALNVFPVPDGDTGTNLYLTFEAAAQHLAEVSEEDLAGSVGALARGALLGARGNSGVILSQLLRGMSEVLGRPAVPPEDGRAADGTAPDRTAADSTAADSTAADGDLVTVAFGHAADLAYAAVDRPVEGTVLTVARAAAEGAAASLSRSLPDVVVAAADAARVALERTPHQLEALRRAGVVDAGGRGLVVLLDAMVETITGIRRPHVATRLPRPTVDSEHEGGGYGGPAYEVMFLLEAPDHAVGPLKTTLAGLGDSLLVVGGDGLWNVHVHVDDAGAVVESAMAAGRPYRIRITYLQQAASLRTTGRGELAERALVMVAHGPGIAALLESNGATIVPAQPRRRPSTAEVLDGIHRATAHEVVILPSDRDTLAVAEAAAAEARDEGLRAAVIPTRSVVQSLAAAAVHEPGRHFDEDVVAMTRAASATRYGAVTIASKQAVTSAGVCQVGDVLGLAEGDIVDIGQDELEVTLQVLDRLLSGGGELVTLVRGLDADDALVSGVTSRLRKGHPAVEVLVYDGGQPLWPLIVGVE